MSISIFLTNSTKYAVNTASGEKMTNHRERVEEIIFDELKAMGLISRNKITMPKTISGILSKPITAYIDEKYLSKETANGIVGDVIKDRDRNWVLREEVVGELEPILSHLRKFDDSIALEQEYPEFQKG